MIFYFSGIKSGTEMDMLREAGVRHVLVDPFDLAHVAGFDGHVALDSGAYREFKGGKTMALNAYTEIAQSREFDLIASKDVIGNPVLSFRRWNELRLLLPPRLSSKVMPVWQWGADKDLLAAYLRESEIVGIGGLVPVLHKDRSLEGEERKAADRERERVLRQLVRLAKQYPGRFHAFGLCWPKAITHLAPYLHSADSSIWLRGARYYEVITVRQSSKGSRYLASSHYRYDDRADDWRQIESRVLRRVLCVESARNLNGFINAHH